MQFIGNVIGNAGVPEFVARLALRDHVKIGALHISGEIESERALSVLERNTVPPVLLPESGSTISAVSGACPCLERG